MFSFFLTILVTFSCRRTGLVYDERMQKHYNMWDKYVCNAPDLKLTYLFSKMLIPQLYIERYLW